MDEMWVDAERNVRYRSTCLKVQRPQPLQLV